MAAAVPNYIGQDFANAPPGHRFGLYFDAWDDRQWKIPDSEKREALKRLAPLNATAQTLLKNLYARQKAAADLFGDSVWRLPAKSTSPFMTGTGIEHPLENGFAFLNPYGLPYLPGSGVKGVLRRAAELLAAGEFGDRQNWNQEIIDDLFGREPDSGDTETARNRGALIFWDVLPEPAGNSLKVEIMTPHYGDYYQGNTTPHDSGRPNPIVFLTLPPNSRFEFFVQCDKAALPESLRNNWQALLETAFQHAFDWLGFGAKTAVGYGQFPGDALQIAKLEREEAERQAQLTARAEAAARAEAELSESQRAIRDLNRWFDDDQSVKRKEPGGRLANRLNELFSEALSWTREEREQLAKLAEAIYGYLDWGSGKKKQERKAKIQQLRGEIK